MDINSTSFIGWWCKKKMKELAIKADMFNVEIALEPEVASLAIFYVEKIKKNY